MTRLPTAFLSGLLLLGCDKPNVAEERAASGNQTPVRKATRREPLPEAPATPRQQLQAAAEIESPAEREKALGEIAWNAIETDPESAHEAFRKLPADSPEKVRLIQHYAIRLTEGNPDEAIEWASGLETEQEIATANSRIALSIAETDPLRAANLLSESGIAGRDFDVALVQVIQRWAARSPQDAAAWTVSFPQGEARASGISHIVERWLPADPAAAFAWYDSLTDTRLRTETARAIEGIILQQPENISDSWLRHTSPAIRGELEERRDDALMDMGDNLPKSAK
jgi:hypothetical protein